MPDKRDEQRRRTEQIGRSPLSTRKRASRSGLALTTAVVGNRCVLTVYGVLDDTTYLRVLDAVAKAALDEYRVPIVDVTRLAAATPSALSVFTTAHSQVGQRSDISMALVCGTIEGQKALRRNGISGDMPVYWRVEAAIAALRVDDEHAHRRRAHAELSPQSRWLERLPTIPLRTGYSGPGQLREPQVTPVGLQQHV